MGFDQIIIMNHTLFISDLHLQPERPDITENFRSFLKTQAIQADALYILGDLFEAWVGSDDCAEFNQSICQAILNLTQAGIPVYFMRGNRDFLIAHDFIKATGCRILPDPTKIDLYGISVLLTHGDMLCTQDPKHQRFRKFSQNPKYNFLFLKLPLFLRRWIARSLRQASRKHTSQLRDDAMDVDNSAVEELMRSHQVLQLIHGHTHRPAIHSLTIDHHAAQRIVLGDWEKQANALIYSANGEFQLLKY